MKNLDWGKLSFGYSKTDYNVRCYYKDGKWSAPEVSDSEMLIFIWLLPVCITDRKHSKV